MIIKAGNLTATDYESVGVQSNISLINGKKIFESVNSLLSSKAL